MVLWSKHKPLSRHKAVALRCTFYSMTACVLPTGAPSKLLTAIDTQQDEGHQEQEPSPAQCVGIFTNGSNILQSEVSGSSALT
jgi:hypothetical protein